MSVIIEIIEYNWMQISVITYMAIMLIYGYYKGLVRMSSNIVSIVMSIVCTRMIRPYALEWVRNNQNLKNYVNIIVQNIVTKNINNATGNLNVEQTIENDALISSLFGANSDGYYIDNQSLYDMFGLDKVTVVISEKITELILSVVTFTVLLIVITIIIKIIFKLLEKIANLPVLTVFNRVTGSILGLVESILYTWIFFIFINFLPKGKLVISAIEQINRPHSFLYLLNEGNIFLKILEFIIK